MCLTAPHEREIAVLGSTKSHQSATQVHQKNPEVDPEFIEKTHLCGQLIFATHSTRKQHSKSPRRPDFASQIGVESDMGTRLKTKLDV